MRIKGVAFTREMELELLERRAEMRRLSIRRREELIRQYPEVAALEKEITEIAIDISAKMLNAQQDALRLKHLADELIQTKRKTLNDILISGGYPLDYLDEQYVCADCNDRGRIGGEICHCMFQLVIEARFKGSGINRIESFESYNPFLFKDLNHRKTMLRIRDYCEAYANSFPNSDKRDLLLLGAPGVGKTFLLNSIGGRILSNGHSVLKLTAYKLVQEVMESFNSEAGKRPDFSLPELLIIDDLGAEPMINNITLETLLSVLCERQDLNRATLIATNLDGDTLKSNYGERIFSRLIAPRYVKAIDIKSENVRLIQ